MMHPLPLATALVLGVLPCACRVTETVEDPRPHVALVTRAEPRRAWTLEEDGRLVGIVVLFEDPESPGDPAKQFYSVRNPLHQELGTLDAQGRAWRFVPHQREAVWVATGTVLEGVRAILDAGAGAVLVELPVEQLRASQGRSR